MAVDYGALAGMYDTAGGLQLKEIEQRYKLGKEEIGARLKIAGQESKDRRYGIDSQRDSEREKLALAREEMEKIGIPTMLINKYVAEKNYEIAQSEMSLKRDIFVEETAQAKAKLQLDREQMERIGIPALEIDRYVAEQNAKIQQAQQTGYFDGTETMDRERFGLEREQFGLDRERFAADEAERQRRYGLDVSKFGADLASTPDTYFQARRFQGVDVPRLMGGAGAATSDAQGGPTPGVATMGSYLAGQDPYSQPQMPGGGAPLTGEETARYTQLIARARQLQAAGEPIPPADAAELAAFQARQGGGSVPGGGFADPMPYAGGGGGGAAALSEQEQARWQQLMARNDEIRAAGGQGLEGADLDEARRFQQRGATYAAPTFAGATGPTYAAPAGGGFADPTPYAGGGGGGAEAGMSYAGGGGAFNEHTGMIVEPAFRADPAAARLSAMNAGGGSGGGGYGDAATPTAAVYGGPAVSASAGPQGYAMPSWYTQQYGAAAQSQYPSQDPRQKQAAMLAKALPPSPFDGLSETDSAALKGMEAIYKGGAQQMAGGEYERLKASGRLGFMQSAGRLLGYDPKEFEASYQSYRPTQGNSRMAG